MPTFNIQYAVGVDGISVLLVVLTALLSPLCVLSSWRSIDHHVKAFMSLVLLVEGAMMAVFTALDVFLFFMSWEITMIPMYFMIILWGGPGRIAAGIKFVLYSLTGSLLLLVGILGLYVQGGRTFDWVQLSAQSYPARRRCGSSRRSCWRSPSSCRWSRSTRGCPTRTRKRPPPAASSWPACC